jgi:hypothetical protein
MLAFTYPQIIFFVLVAITALMVLTIVARMLKA